ncbi:hypothetical protein HNY73_009388 [Argiope bruennichi]|uniref:Uncharacterized protein n=1 Tax=Argiope bruennichi TaxID=94029 RepID=A0A8T0FC33_ARGBR|nr:hypothetical protein HNY73_009388 [Argiope bruennichi]
MHLRSSSGNPPELDPPPTNNFPLKPQTSSTPANLAILNSPLLIVDTTEKRIAKERSYNVNGLRNFSEQE